MIGKFRRLVLEQDAAGTETAARLGRWAAGAGVEVVVERDPRRRLPDFLGVECSKQVLRVSRHVGATLRPCTGRSDRLLCCNLRVLPQVVGCPLDCSYCILQQYQNRGEITVRADPEPILDELVSELSRQPRRLQRVCTGQVGDSLALEPEVGFAAAAVRRFAGLDNAVLELKTKTDRVESLLGLEHGGRTILSWSLAPQEVAAAEEHGAASLPARLRAARRAAGAGYLLAFHLDPLVTVDGDPRPHLKVLGQLASAVPADSVAYLSLGTVRFHPSMRRSVRGRFAGSRVALAELLPDVDGKLRLAPPLRVQLYRELARKVRRILPETFLYLCMEPPRVWRQALGVEHTHRREVELALARSLDRRYGLAPCKPLPEAYAED